MNPLSRLAEGSGVRFHLSTCGSNVMMLSNTMMSLPDFTQRVGSSGFTHSILGSI